MHCSTPGGSRSILIRTITLTHAVAVLPTQGAKEEMDQTVCQAAKFLNALRYERQKREARLFELQEELERMRHLERASSEQQAVDDKTTSLENALDKANIKYDMASCITRRYRDILDKLREVSTDWCRNRRGVFVYRQDFLRRGWGPGGGLYFPVPIFFFFSSLVAT